MKKNFDFKNLKMFLFLLNFNLFSEVSYYNNQQNGTGAINSSGQQQGIPYNYQQQQATPYHYQQQQATPYHYQQQYQQNAQAMPPYGQQQQQPINVIINNSANANNSSKNINNANNENKNFSAESTKEEEGENKNRDKRKNVPSFEELIGLLEIFVFKGKSYHEINKSTAYKLFPEDNQTVYNEVKIKKVDGEEDLDRYSNSSSRYKKNRYNTYNRPYGNKYSRYDRGFNNYKETEQVETKIVPTVHDLNLEKRNLFQRNIEKLEENINNLQKWNPENLETYKYQMDMAKKNGYLPNFSFYGLVIIDIAIFVFGFIMSNVEKELVNNNKFQYNNGPVSINRPLAVGFLSLFSGLVTSLAYPNREFYRGSISQIMFFLLNLLSGLGFLIENPTSIPFVPVPPSVSAEKFKLYKEKDKILGFGFALHLIFSFIIFSSLKSVPDSHNNLVKKMNNIGFILGGKEEKTGRIMKGIFIPIEETRILCFETL